jgi:hypothetical protein
MRYITNFSIDEVIVHILNPRGEKLFLSDGPMNLEKDAMSKTFVHDHIKNVISDTYLRAAKFNRENPNNIGNIMNSFFTTLGKDTSENQSASRKDLLELSRDLAGRLYPIIENNRSISDCDLGVCLFHGEESPQQSYLALLKFDPSFGFRNRIDVVGGKKVVNMVFDSLVFTSQRLQKAALVQAPGSAEPYDVLLLDKQMASEKGPEIAKFFRVSFLDCDFVYDSTQLTGELYLGILAAENELLLKNNIQEAIDFANRSRLVFQSPKFYFNKWIQSLPYSTETNQLISGIVSGNLHAEDFDIDPQRVLTFPVKVRFQGSNGLIIEIDLKNIGNLEMHHYPATAIKPAHWKICAESLTWKKVK